MGSTVDKQDIVPVVQEEKEMNKNDAVFEILGIAPNVKTILTTQEAYDQFKLIKELKDATETKEKALREQMFALAEINVLPDEKGSYTVQFEDGTGYQKQARNTVTLLSGKVMTYAKEHGLARLWALVHKFPTDEDRKAKAIDALIDVDPTLLDSEEVVDEGALEELVIDGTIPQEDFVSFTEKKTTFALIDLAKKRK